MENDTAYLAEILELVRLKLLVSVPESIKLAISASLLESVGTGDHF